MQNLCVESTGKLILNRLKVHSIKSLDPLLLGSIFEKTGGNPQFMYLLFIFFIYYFSVKLIDRLWSFGIIIARDTVHGLVADYSSSFAENNDLDSIDPILPIPFVTQRILMAFVDKLNISQQMTLKIASSLCIGKKGYYQNAFDSNVLSVVHPYKSFDDFNIGNDLESLARMGLIKPSNSVSISSTISFISQDVYKIDAQFLEYLSAPSVYHLEDPDRIRSVFTLISNPTIQLSTDSIDWFPAPMDNLVPSKKYFFTYGLLRDILYTNMLHQQRLRIHSKVSEYLETILLKSAQESHLYRRHVLLANIHSKHRHNVSVSVSPRSSNDYEKFEISAISPEHSKAKRYIISQRRVLEYEV